MNQKFIPTLNSINLFSALLLTASLIYPFPMQRWLIAFFFTSYVIEFFAEKKWQSIQINKTRIFYLIVASFILLGFIYYPFEKTHIYFGWLIQKRFALFGFACVGFFGVNNKYKLSYFLNTFIISSIVSIFYILFIRVGLMEFISNPQRFEIFNTDRNNYVNMHRVFNLNLNISLIGIWYILSKSWRQVVLWKKWLYFAASIVIFFTLLISEGRSGFIAGLFLLLIIVFNEIRKKKKIIGIILSIIVVLTTLVVAINHQGMSEKSFEAENRLFLWKSAFSVIKESPIIGQGISDAQVHFDEARKIYQTEEYRLFFINCKVLDSHNQFLQTIMEFGLFGLLILIFIYIFPPIIADKGRKLFSVMLMFLCILQSMFDPFINGPFASIFGLLLVLILTVKDDINLKTSKTRINK